MFSTSVTRNQRPLKRVAFMSSNLNLKKWEHAKTLQSALLLSNSHLARLKYHRDSSQKFSELPCLSKRNSRFEPILSRHFFQLKRGHPEPKQENLIKKQPELKRGQYTLSYISELGGHCMFISKRIPS